MSAPKAEKTNSDPVKSKASFKEKKEYEEINAKIQTLTNEKDGLVSKINTGSEDHQLMIDWAKQIQKIEKDLEDLEMRWLELSELEGID